MFGLFKKTPRHEINEHVWMSKAARLEGLYKALKVDAHPTQWLIYHFPETANEVENVLTGLGKGTHRPSSLTEATGGGAWLIPSTMITDTFSTRDDFQPGIHILEHYPLPDVDAALVSLLSRFFPGAALNLYTSLEDPLMQLFGSERIISLMEKMGVKPDEAISHAMVSKSIVNAQKKVAEKTTSELKTNSQEEWFRKNYPEINQ